MSGTLSEWIENLLWGGPGAAPAWIVGDVVSGPLEISIYPQDIITVAIFIICIYSMFRIFGLVIRRIGGR